ncbi:hypothetical protein CJD36_019340 [Flavipsychrobacter stenotrophus]|uniref:BIG2 domain-containing protein n=1 Tax=Flavipsychrobacter stenotrophus TaxID=2077091 RepID=A0A2S7SR69_9BACT|nr:T9SS type A sorting domain-containing protein [Flavipsychrobacter stenotrophus]PQJ09400.1 hypothetical protein CJD36_019340 [Flavipsychrobacter stenotrophus]
MKKQFLITMVALLACFASYGFSGPTSACPGNTLYFYDSLTTGGTWSSSNTAIATIDPTSGVAYAVASGTVTISYVSSAGLSSAPLTVDFVPLPITGTLSLCTSYTTALADATPGGTWYSGDTYIATVDYVTGVVYGVNPGTADIYYSLSTGCPVIATVTVSGTPAGPIIGPSVVCLGSAITINDSLSGGVWSSSNPAVATVVGTSGFTATLTGLTLGTADISYTFAATGGCGPISTVLPITVSNTTDVGIIYGTGSVNVGSVINLGETVYTGTWSVTPSSLATIDAYGNLTGVSAGAATVSYTTTGCGGVASATFPVTILPFDGISGQVNFTSGAYYGPVKVWLITYVAPMLTAVDSVNLYASGTSVSYQFVGVSPNSYRIKAATSDSLAGTTGYIPTYHTSSFYWNTADVLVHASGAGDINQDINMMAGTVTTGPGFVAGDVTAGANKGTSVGIPVNGMKMYILNATTMQLVQGTTTDATGHYTFSNIPVGQTYMIFPDSLNYLTTPCSWATLTAAAPSMTTASFKQNTVAKTITPIPVGVGSVSADAAAILAFPNPTNGHVNIAWTLPAAQQGTVSVCDITGREVYSNVIDMTAGAGMGQVDISSLTNGLYTISVRSAAVNYTNKMQVQR